MTAWSDDAATMSNLVVAVDDSATAAHALEWTARVLAPSATIHAVNAVSPAVELAVAVVQYDSSPLVERRRRDLKSVLSAPARAAGATIVCHVIEDTTDRVRCCALPMTPRPR